MRTYYDDKGSGGLGFWSVIQIILIVLKLFSLIKWSWLWVLCPTWISLSIALVVIIKEWIWWKS